MKKNELIELLSNIPGNPDVCLWNGYVGDFMNIKKELTVLELVKESKEWLRDVLNMEADRDSKERFSDEAFEQIWNERKPEWELPNPHVPPEEMNRWYGTKRKKIVVLDAKLRGKKDWDRQGSIEY